MSEEKSTRLGLAARKFNISSTSVVDFLATKGHKIDANPNSKITSELMGLLEKEFASSEQEKKEASEVKIGNKHQNIPPVVTEATSKLIQKNPLSEGIFGKNEETEYQESTDDKEVIISSNVQLPGIKVLGKIDLNAGKTPKQESKPTKAVESKVQNTVVETPKVAETPKVEEQSKTEVVENKVEAPKNIEKAPKEEAKSVIKQDNKVSAPIVESKEPVKVDQPISEETIEKVVSILKTDDISSLDQSTIDSLPEEVKMQLIEAKADKLQGLTVLGKIELPVEKKPKPNEHHQRDRDKKKRKRLKDGPVVSTSNQNNNNNNFVKKGGPNNHQQGNNPHHQNNQNRGNFNQNQPNSGGPNNKPADNNNRQSPAQIAPKSVGNKFSNNTSTSGTPHQTGDRNNQGGKGPRNKFEKPEVNKSEVEGNIKNTMAKLGGGQKAAFANRTKYKKEKRSFKAEQREKRQQEEDAEAKILKVSEFVSANDLASMMDVSVNEVISTCMSLGMFVSINQRLDAEAIAIIADEFEFEVQFISAEAEEEEAEVIVDSPEDLENRAPIVTIMGHVDHGKTSLLDYIRKANIVASEAGGITQHIGAYDVKTQSGKRIAFLDTPGHEAFTAMRARGAKITDIVIIVVAADDDVMPQTKEAINHALNAGVPIVIAINKIDKPNANPDKIKEALSKENILVEEWGGKYQCQEISAKKGTGVEDLLEKVLLEAELLDLKANPNKAAKGTVIEASLDKGRGYVSTIMIQEGTLKIGDIILAGHHFGRVRAMLDHKSKKLKEAGPSTPVVLLGLSGAPQAGDSVKVMESEREAREIATRREQIIREQSIRTKKHITLDEIGRRLAIGNFKQLNIIIKGDVDGSVEALTDSLLKLSTEEVAVSIVHKGVGQISESDVLLASAADAIILGFQVRPSQNARKLAETEEIEIRHYSIIYDAIEEVKSAMEGMLEPKKEEVIVGTVDVRAVFKISKVGIVAGCYVLSGHVKRSLNIRLVRDGIVMHDGRIDQLKRIKEDVSEVKSGYECGISIKGFNDIQEGDTIEVYEEREIKRKL